MGLMKSILAIVVVMAIGGTANRAQAGSSVLVTFVPSSSQVQVGQEFTVDIFLQALLPMDSGVVGYGFDLVFDDTIISYDPITDIALGANFDSPPVPGDGDGIAGLVLPPADPLNGSGILLATVTFTADQIGLTTLTGAITPGDPLEGFVINGGDMVNAQFGEATILVTAIPLPPALLAGTVGLGIIRLVGGRKRRHSLYQDTQ